MPLDLCQLGGLTFSEPDENRFPCLRIAYEAFAAGGSVPAVMNAANEIAVEAFLNRKISFLGIPRLIEEVVSLHQSFDVTTIDQVLHADLWSRKQAQELIAGGIK